LAKREPYLIDGVACRSVTETIDLLGVNKAPLMQWVAWCGREGLDWERYRDDAASLGSETHACIERALRGEDQPSIDADPFAPSTQREARYLFSAWLQWATGREFEIIAIEQKLQIANIRMHGTPDFVAREDGKVVLYDWKSSTKSKAKLEHWIQAAAYCIMLEDGGLDVDSVCIVTINKKTKIATGERKTMAELSTYRELWWCAHSISQLLDKVGA
jgi:hypothetical protein